MRKLQDSLAEWSKALASGASPQGREFEPHSCHFYCQRPLPLQRSCLRLPGTRGSLTKTLASNPTALAYVQADRVTQFMVLGCTGSKTSPFSVFPRKFLCSTEVAQSTGDSGSRPKGASELLAWGGAVAWVSKGGGAGCAAQRNACAVGRSVACQFARAVKGVDLGSTAGDCTRVRNPPLAFLWLVRTTYMPKHSCSLLPECAQDTLAEWSKALA